MVDLLALPLILVGPLALLLILIGPLALPLFVFAVTGVVDLEFVGNDDILALWCDVAIGNQISM
ncbi:hypothetical protein GCM10023196_083950 [Actinoallomurus vinaceus]|uniref:TRAP C4-dicarboxylate transport system permease DctM subunit domain-containing protein n=1 Tax=Actinoallomurus vinaceus TaxID=1080074 RepID=A0ABP8UP21_9ACTN